MRLRHVSLIVLILAGLVTSSQHGSAAGQSPIAPASIPRLEHTTFTLANGLKVIFSQDKRLPMVAVNLWYHVGPANEIPGRTGFAHLFEHMMFQGSKHVAADTHFKLLEAAGASDINGTTDFDRTNYFETVPSNQLELALWIESDRMGYLLDVLDREGARQPARRRPQRAAAEPREPAVRRRRMKCSIRRSIPAGHPYHGVVIGSHADLAAAQLGDVQQFFRQYYTPNNASLAIVGDFDPAAARKLVEKYFGSLKRGPDVPQITATTPPITAEKRLTVTDTIKLPRVYMAWLTPAIFKPGDAEADLAADILGGGKSSRLYKALVYDKQIAQAVTATQESLILGSKFTIEATARPGPHRRGARDGHQRGAAPVRRERPRRQRARTRQEHHRDPHHHRPRDARRVRRQGRSPEQLRALPGDAGLPAPGPASAIATPRRRRSRPSPTQHLQPTKRGRAVRGAGREEAGGRTCRRAQTPAGRRRPERQRRRAVAEGDAQAGLGQGGAVPDARPVHAARTA